LNRLATFFVYVEARVFAWMHGIINRAPTSTQTNELRCVRVALVARF
jgi:hypothetical protein